MPFEQQKIKHMPTKLVKFNKYKHKKAKWITQGLLNLIRFRDRLYIRLKREKPNTLEYNTIFINLKTFNSILKRSIRAAKKTHFEIKIHVENNKYYFFKKHQKRILSQKAIGRWQCHRDYKPIRYCKSF